jgi:hypothetical protein
MTQQPQQQITIPKNFPTSIDYVKGYTLVAAVFVDGFALGILILWIGVQLLYFSKYGMWIP